MSTFVSELVLCFSLFRNDVIKRATGSTERTLKIFLPAFSKSSRMSILLDVYFLLKHLSIKFCLTVRSESIAP